MRTNDVAAVALAVMSVLSPGAAGAAELTVLAGMGVVSGVRDVALAFERATGHKVIVSFEAGPSLMQKVTSNAPADLVVHYPEAIDDLIKQGKAVAGSRVDLASSGIGLAVRKGAPKPDIGTPEALTRGDRTHAQTPVPLGLRSVQLSVRRRHPRGVAFGNDDDDDRVGIEIRRRSDDSRRRERHRADLAGAGIHFRRQDHGEADGHGGQCDGDGAEGGVMGSLLVLVHGLAPVSFVPACFGCCNPEVRIHEFAIRRDWPCAFDAS